MLAKGLAISHESLAAKLILKPICPFWVLGLMHGYDYTPWLIVVCVKDEASPMQGPILDLTHTALSSHGNTQTCLAGHTGSVGLW